MIESGAASEDVIGWPAASYVAASSTRTSHVKPEHATESGPSRPSMRRTWRESARVVATSVVIPNARAFAVTIEKLCAEPVPLCCVLDEEGDLGRS